MLFLFTIGVPELIVFIITPFIIIPIIALVDVYRSGFNTTTKLVSVLLILLIPFLGPIAYLIFARKLQAGA